MLAVRVPYAVKASFRHLANKEIAEKTFGNIMEAKAVVDRFREKAEQLYMYAKQLEEATGGMREAVLIRGKVDALLHILSDVVKYVDAVVKEARAKKDEIVGWAERKLGEVVAEW